MNVTPALFAKSLLQRLGLPVTDNNVAALVSFQAHEGGHMANAAAFNPMNTTMKMDGSHAVTPVGVQAYTSWDQGIEATAKTLTNGAYGPILDALKASAHPDVTMKAIAASPWGCTICANAPASSFQAYRDKTFPGTAPLGLGFGLGLSPQMKTVLAAGAIGIGLGLIVLAVAGRKPKRGGVRVFRRA